VVRVAGSVASVAISMTPIAVSVTMTIAHTVTIARLGISVTLVVGSISLVRVARPVAGV